MDTIYIKDVIDISFKDQHETSDVVYISEQFISNQAAQEEDSIGVSDNIKTASHIDLKIDDIATPDEYIAAMDSISIATSTSAKDDAFMYDTIADSIFEVFVEAISVTDVVDVHL